MNNIASSFLFLDEVSYKIWEEKDGWAFDTTVYNKYVKVYYNEGFAKISLVWDQDSHANRMNYHWGFTSDPLDQTISEAQILNNTHNLYCNNVASDGYCSLYTETE